MWLDQRASVLDGRIGTDFFGRQGVVGHRVTLTRDSRLFGDNGPGGGEDSDFHGKANALDNCPLQSGLVFRPSPRYHRRMMHRDAHVWVVIPAHNRRETTLSCLGRLEAAGVLAWARVLIVDDGSRDGTSVAVSEAFPTVDIVQGDGSLWWTGAIALGMQRAIERGADAIVWLNDDCLPEPRAIARLVDVALAQGGLCGGVSRAREDGEVLYAGGDLVGTWPPRVCAAPTRLTGCQFLHGNLVAISRGVWERVGLPNARSLPHCWGDLEYTYRAHRAGLPVLLDPEARAVNEVNREARSNSWLDPRLSAADLVRGLVDPKAWWYLRAVAYFKVHYFGASGALALASFLLKLGVVSGAKLCLPASAVVRLGAHLASEQRQAPYFVPST